MADRDDPFGTLHPFHRGKLPNFTRNRRVPHRRAERILREKMLDVGEQQFLMLLLVMDAEGDERQRGRRQAGQGALHRGIDMRAPDARSEEHTSELQSLMRISYAVFCLKKKTTHRHTTRNS